MVRWFTLLVVLLIPTYAGAILGDLNKDGQVDFGDFFLFADQFGKKGPLDLPDTVVVVRVDTLQRTVRDTTVVVRVDTLQQVVEHTVRDTVVVVRVDTLQRTVRDTVVIVRVDTLRQVIERTVRDTVRLVQVDTVFASSDSDRPPIRSWSAIAAEAEPAIYWLGVSTTTASSTLFLGTGFAYSNTDIATNAHVAIALNSLANRLEALGATPLIVAIRSRTSAYGNGTFSMSRGANVHPEYDGTVNSADVATLIIGLSESKRFPSRLTMAPRATMIGSNAGDEIATLGFPGELETETLDALLQPIPTFKTGSVSALRPYRSSTRSWRASNKIVQHNLDLTPGTSGSPILNNRGEVIGINNAGVTGTSLGFAIRGDELREMLEADKVEYPGLYSDLRLKKVSLPPLDRGLDTRGLLELLAGSR